MKRNSITLITAVMGIFLLAIWIYLIDFSTFLQTLAKMNIVIIIPLTILFFGTYFIRSIRWKLILSPIEHINIFQSFNLCMINYLFNFLIPIHAGEIVKSALLKEMKGTSISKSLPTVYIDKMLDLLPIFMVFILAPFLDSRLSAIIYWASAITFSICLGFCLTLVLLIYKREVFLKLSDRVLFLLPLRARKRTTEFLNLFADGLLSLLDLSQRWGEVVLLTILAVVIHCVFLWLFFYAFGVNLPMLTVLIAYALINTSFILPAPPGFSGSLELTFLFIFSYLYNYDKNLVSAVAASSHILTAVLFGFLGLCSMAIIGTRVSTLFKVESKDTVLP